MRHVKLVVGLLLLIGFTYGAPSRFGRVWSDARHFHEFQPSKAEIVSYRCRNVNYVMFNDCTIHFQVDGQPTESLLDVRFGRAPAEMPVLLETVTAPRLFSTDVSLATILNRAAFAFMCLGGLALIWGALITWLLRKARGRQAALS